MGTAHIAYKVFHATLIQESIEAEYILAKLSGNPTVIEFVLGDIQFTYRESNMLPGIIEKRYCLLYNRKGTVAQCRLGIKFFYSTESAILDAVAEFNQYYEDKATNEDSADNVLMQEKCF